MEMADNRACTSLNPHAILTPWGDGKDHPDDYGITNLSGSDITSSSCISSPNREFIFTFACVAADI